MALTKNFRRTGAAAVNELHDELWLRHSLAMTARERFLETLDELKSTTGWEAWYDDDANVPAELDFRNIQQIEAVIVRMRLRIEAMKTG